MKHLLSTALILSSFALVGGFTKVTHHCDGIVEKNDWHIPVTGIRSGGISQTQYNQIMDKMEAYFAPIVAAKGGHYVINRLWDDDTVNSSAEQSGGDWIINMYGGIARYPAMTVDGELLVACHETGHHLGGAPKGTNMWGETDWASVEGEADYYATLDCMRFILGSEDNVEWVKTHSIDPVVKSTCESTYTDAQEQSLCMRTSLAGLVMGDLFQALRKEKVAPRFDNPDMDKVSETMSDHPPTQCRLDTYYQASLCVHDLQQAPDDNDPRVGTCYDYTKVGARPRCWFQPADFSQAPSLAQSN